MADDLCPGFVGWKADRCKRCFRLMSQHPDKDKESADASKSGKKEIPETRRMSWRERVYGPAAVAEHKKKEEAEQLSATVIPSSGKTANENEEKETRRQSPILNRKTKTVILKAEVSVDDKPSEQVSMKTAIVSDTLDSSEAPSRRSESPAGEQLSFRSANSGEDSLGKSQSFESLATTTMDTKSMFTAVSGSEGDSQRSGTPTDLDVDVDETQGYMNSIKAQLEIMENRCAKLEKENEQLRGSQLSLNQAGVSTDANELIAVLQEKLALAENLCQDYRDENTVLKCELRELQESVSKNSSHQVKELKDKLSAAESLCEELMEENENLKKEQQDLQREIEELQDQYREEEIEEFRELQRELEQTAKNCRILQFKLRKSERIKDQTEADRQHLEEKVKNISALPGSIPEIGETRRTKELESELRIAKEVSVRLHNELEALEEKRCKLEDQNFYYKEKIRELETREKLMEASRQKYEQKRGPRQQVIRENSGTASPPDYNVPELLKDLQDALERETDLKDQLKFAEEDLQSSRKKLTDLETENEGLMKQLAKFTTPTPGRGRPPMKRSFSEGQTQIQLELAEHEAAVLKEKLTKMEKDNERTMSKMSLMEKELKKAGGKTEFTESEIQASIPDTYYKQKIKVLEEEIEELKLKLENQQTEADQDISWPMGSLSAANRRQRLANRSRSSSDTSDLPESQQQQQQPTTSQSSGSNVDMKRQVALIEQETVVLRQRISDLERENERLNEENKKFHLGRKPVGPAATWAGQSGKISKPSPEFQEMKEKMGQMQKDIERFIARIAELEKEKEVLNKEVERRKKLESIKSEAAASTSPMSSRFNVRLANMQELRDKVQQLLKEHGELTENLKAEKQKSSELEKQLADYKQVINQSDNQKLVTMATKVEVLNQQLRESQERFSAMHQRMIASGNGKQQGEKYEDALKEQIEKLEAELAAQRVKSANLSPTEVRKAQKNAASFEGQEKLASELSECNDLIITVQNQVDRVYKQLEQLETATGSGEGTPAKLSPVMPRSQSTKSIHGDEKAQILKDVAQMKSELDSLKNNLKKRKSTSHSFVANGTTSLDENDKLGAVPSSKDSQTVAELEDKCSKQEKSITELREQLELAQQDKESAQQESAAATERLLQTEERWNKELDRLRESYETQVKDLKYYLEEADRLKEEKASLLKDRNTSLNEKTKKVSELEAKVTKQESELKTRHKDILEKLEAERKKAKEFETKYQKLEELYESDRDKLTGEREKFKTDLSDLKKKYDDTLTDFEKLRQTYERKQGMWHKEKTDLEARIKKVEEELQSADKKASQKAAEMTSAETRKLVTELNQLKRKVETDAEEFKREKTSLLGQMEQKSKDLEFRTEEIQRMKKETEMLKSRIDDQKQQLEETRKARDDAREELSRWQQTWARERSELAHKLRQEGKVQQAEQQALQLKYENRIKVMEESSKRFQTQLTQTRRERDQHRDALAMTEKKLIEMRQRFETEEKETQQKILKLEKQANEVADVTAKLEQEQLAHNTLKKNFEADQRLWNIEREQLLSNTPQDQTAKPPSSTREKGLEKRLNEAVKIGEDLRKQSDEMKKAFDKETEQLRKQLEKYRQESRKEKSDLQRKLREAQENVKVLEIDRRNMLSNKDENEMEKTLLQNERDTLMQKLHDTEIHQLANKYKLDKVADQISDLLTKIRYSEPVDSEKREMQETAKKALEQLLAVREDMARTRELGRALDQLDQDDKVSVPSLGKSSDGDSGNWTGIGERLAPIGSEAEVPAKKSIGPVVERSLPPSPLTPSGDKTGMDISGSLPRPGYFPYKTRSASSECGWEARIAEIRLRSPSPSPRKLTNYPEAPPSMILNVDKGVEYDKEGKRHWTRNTMRRSISLDPNAGPGQYFLFDPTEESTLAPVTECAKDSRSGTYNTPSNQLSASTELSTTEGSSKAGGRIVADFFATLSRTREANIKEKRKLFGVRKSRSVETSDTAQKLGAIGVQTLPPALPADALPESLQSSASTLGTPPTGGVKKSGSGSKLFEKFRSSSGRSVTRTEAENKAEGSTDKLMGKPDSSWIGRGRAAMRSTSEENVGLKVYSSKSRYTALNRLGTSYGSFRRSSLISLRFFNR